MASAGPRVNRVPPVETALPGHEALPVATAAKVPTASDGADGQTPEFSVVNGELVWRYVGEGADAWRALPGIGVPGNVSMISATHAGWEAVPIFTVGDRVGDYRPPGILDGFGAFKKDATTVRLLSNHELRPQQGYAYELSNGTAITGSRISYFDIDYNTLKVKESGLAYDTIYNRYGEEVDAGNIDDSGDSGPLRRFCSSVFVPKGSYGLVDDIYFTGRRPTAASCSRWTWTGGSFTPCPRPGEPPLKT